MKDFRVYEHIHGLPKFLDSPNEEIEDCVYNDCYTEEQAEKYINNINTIQPTDKYGRERHLYIVWID